MVTAKVRVEAQETDNLPAENASSYFSQVITEVLLIVSRNRSDDISISKDRSKTKSQQLEKEVKYKSSLVVRKGTQTIVNRIHPRINLNDMESMMKENFPEAFVEKMNSYLTNINL